jgi:DNA repair exonuclease SbcCD ATPase subunit
LQNAKNHVKLLQHYEQMARLPEWVDNVQASLNSQELRNEEHHAEARDFYEIMDGFTQRYDADQQETRLMQNQFGVQIQNVLAAVEGQGRHHGRLSGQVQDMNGHIQGHIQRHEEHHEELRANHKELRDLVEQYDRDRHKLLADAAAASQERTQRQMDEVRDWISGPRSAQSDYHKKCLEPRAEFPGTAAWVFRDDLISDWMHDDAPDEPVVRITGKKGAGKSSRGFSL